MNGEVHNHNVSGTTYTEIKIVKPHGLSEWCIQYLSQPCDVHTDRWTSQKSYAPLALVKHNAKAYIAYNDAKKTGNVYLNNPIK